MTSEMRLATQSVIEATRLAAQEAILPRFRKLTLEDVSQKTGPNDLVTVADTEAEAQIVAALAQSWPEAMVLGEEGVSRDPDLRAQMGLADPVVIVDPVDGTWNFAHGLALFGMLVAVARQGRPVWGMLYDPICDDWIEAAAGEPSRMVSPQGARLLRCAPDKPVEAISGYVPLGLYSGAEKRLMVEAALRHARVTSLRCSVHEYRLLAQGHVDFVLSGPTPHPWDHAAGALAVQGAGGVTRFLDGGDYDTRRLDGALLSASCEAVWQKVAESFAGLV